MRIDGIECWNKDCVYRDGLFEFSCKAHVGFEHVDADQYVKRCQKFMKRTLEHEVIIKTLKQLSNALKIARKKKVDKKYPLLKASWIGRRHEQKETIKALAHNWINRRK